jgi:hypothetical protein
MHASSLENMQRCHQRYIRGSTLDSRDDVVILDVGGADVNGGYREVFSNPNHQYLTVDINPAAGVDIVLQDPYRLPISDGSVDIVLSGQMLEHCEFFWLTFVEMIRVLKPDGYLFLIAPSAGPVHRFPVDCYRFNPDAFTALAKYANCRLVESWLDERGPWRDLVGVFTKHQLPAKNTLEVIRQKAATFDPVNSPPGIAEEEATKGAVDYLLVLKKLHAILQPANYLEIGVRHGRSLVLAECHAIGVDPAPDIKFALPATTQVIVTTSDDYFANQQAGEARAAPDLVFIDGMHLFEYVLRDFMHIERMAKPGTVIVIDDIFPSHPAQAERQRRTRVWTGDVWKLHQLLSEVRPDLLLLPIDTAPSGLLLVTGLNPGSQVLWNIYNPMVRQYKEAMTPPERVLMRTNAIDPASVAISDFLSEVTKVRDGKSNLRFDDLRQQLSALANANAQ